MKSMGEVVTCGRAAAWELVAWEQGGDVHWQLTWKVGLVWKREETTIWCSWRLGRGREACSRGGHRLLVCSFRDSYCVCYRWSNRLEMEKRGLVGAWERREGDVFWSGAVQVHGK